MRISADDIDDDPRPNSASQEDQKLTAKVTVYIKDFAKVKSITDSVDALMKEFNNMKIQPHAIDDDGNKSEAAMCTEDKMQDPEEGPSQSPCKSCLKSPNNVSTWYTKMKEEIKKEVVEDVMQKLKVASDKTDSGSCASSQIADNNSEPVLHEHVFCDSCNEQIRGIRYKCGNCEDFDLCEACEAKGPQNGHNSTHIFLKIRTPSCFFTLREGGKKKIYQVPLSSASAGGILLNKTAFDAKPEPSEECFRAKFIRDESFPDGSFVPPGRQFEKIWRVCNSGTKAWTEDTVFHLVWNNEGLKASSNVVAAPRLKSGEEGTVSVSFMAPETFGHFESYWEFHHNGKSFGDTFWCVVRVEPISMRTSSPYPPKSQLYQWMLKNKRKAVDEMRKKKGCRKKEVKQIVEVLSAVNDDSGPHRRNRSIRKSVPISQTATPNNTPFDLSPPKSPEPQEFLETKSEVTIIDTQDKISSKDIYEISDDKVSIRTLSSSDSDSEFVVIPMPKCFSLLESLPQQTSDQDEFPVSNSKKDESQDLTLLAFQDISISECETDDPEQKMELMVEMKEDCDKRFILSSNISLNSSPSSSSISILDSENFYCKTSCPNCSSTSSFKEVDCTRKDSASQVPDVVNSEGTETSSSTFPKFPLLLSTEEQPQQSPLEHIPLEHIPLEHIPLEHIQLEQPSQQSRLEQPQQSRLEQPQQQSRLEQSQQSRSEQPQQSRSEPPQQSRSEPPQQPQLERQPTGDTTPKTEGERTIQVLPEGLVTGTLLAAATVYNTARAVISNFHSSRTENKGSSTDSESQTTHTLCPADQLVEMGFCNRTLNEGLLKEHSGDVARVVAELINLSDNEWYASRHNPTAPSE